MKTHCKPLPATLLAIALLSLPVYAKVWISEFMASNSSGLTDRDGDTEDWLELYNDGITEVQLGGWSLTDDQNDKRKWILPDVSLAPDEYLVIFASGENRRTPGEELHANFSLSRSGEYLALIRPDGAVEHGYSPAFPGQFTDVSFGLRQTGQNSARVAEQGSPARAGVPASEADFAAHFSGWESDVNGSFTGSTWRAIELGSGYDQSGSLGGWIGANGEFETELMDGSGSLFVRVPFEVNDPPSVTRLTLHMRWNDGFVAYVNGAPVASNRAPESPAWDSLATADRDVGENDDWNSFPIDLAEITLHAGENLLAIHGLRHTTDDSELFVLPELEIVTGGIESPLPVFHSTPTPGEANGRGATDLPPLLTEVTSSVDQPLGSSASPPAVVTARVEETLHPVAEVRLFYRVQFDAEMELAMKDDGAAPDVAAGDGIYTAEMPTSGVRRGFMLRWRVEASDTTGETARDPAYEDPRDSDEYYGTVAVDSSLDSSLLPVLHTFVENEGAANTRSGTRVAIYYLGRFYDNVQMDLHGQSTSGGSFPKKSYDIDFNRGNRFLWKEGEGKVKDINLLTNWADKSKVRNTMAYEFLKRCGVAYHYAFPVRVERNGLFWSVQDMVEDGDDRFLERIGLDGDGALYKMYDRMENAGTANKKTRREEDRRDLQGLISRLSPSLSIERRRRYAYDNLDIPACVNYLAALTVAGISDAGHKNYYLYRDTEGTGEWRIIPWDVDLSAGRRWTSSETYFHDPLHWDFWNYGAINRLWGLIYDTPDYRDMYLRRIETLRREVLLPPGTPEEDDWYKQMVHELEDRIDPQGARSDEELDYRKWGSWGNRFRMREAAARILDEWLPNKRDFIFSPSRNQGGVRVPGPQPEVPRVFIEEFDYNPVSGNQDEEYIILANRHRDSVDLSGWTISGAVDFVIPAGTVIPAGRGDEDSDYIGLLHVAKSSVDFRARAEGPQSGEYRLIVGGYDGQLSARGETIELRNASGALVDSAMYPGDPSAVQETLRVTEFNYHPVATTPAEEAAIPGVTAEDFEWIELRNTGTEALDLENVRFVDGIEVTFGQVTLDAGERLILAKNPAAFAMRHPGYNGQIAGPYEGLINNDGEELRLVDAQGENVLRIEFNDRWYPAADGAGRTVVLRDEEIAWNLYDEASSWGSSVQDGGSAGLPNGGYETPFLGWQAAEFSAEELEDPQISDALANPDGDPYVNWEEYALGLDPHRPDEPLFRGEFVTDGNTRYLGAIVRRRARAADLSWQLQTSQNGEDWEDVPHEVVSREDHADGTETWVIRETVPPGDATAGLARLEVTFLP